MTRVEKTVEHYISPVPVAPLRPGWPRRHPIATVLLVFMFGFIALAVAIPSDEGNDRLSIFLGLMILAAPILFIFWLVTRWIDRRDERAQSAMAPSPAFAAPTATPEYAPPPASPTAHSMPAPEPVAPSPPIPSALEATAQFRIEPQGHGEPARHVTLDDLLAMTPTEFEQLCVRALLNIGYQEVRRTGDDGDLAADVTGKDSQDRSFVAQCRRLPRGSEIGAAEIQTFIGMKIVHHQADRGAMMTTAAFSAPAIDLARQHDIVLIDGDDIVKVLNLMGSQ